MNYLHVYFVQDPLGILQGTVNNLPDSLLVCFVCVLAKSL